jgi:hypothetical protein
MIKMLTAQSLTIFTYRTSGTSFVLPSMETVLLDYTGTALTVICRQPDQFQRFLLVSTQKPLTQGLWRWQGTIQLDVISGSLIAANGKWTPFSPEEYAAWSRV